MLQQDDDISPQCVFNVYGQDDTKRLLDLKRLDMSDKFDIQI